MTQRGTLALVVGLGLAACGGSSENDGPDPINLANFQAADAIVGQSLATGSAPDNGGITNQVGLDLPGGHVGNGSFYVADTLNDRVMGWNAIPTGLGLGADFVIGQVDFASTATGTTAGLLASPRCCWIASNALFVCDLDNSRVLVYSPPPTGNASANLALGKPDLTTAGATSGVAGLNSPVEVCVALNRIVVSDSFNNRVMIWNGIPAVSGAPAQIVVGQPDFVTTSAGTTAAKMSTPAGVWTDGTKLVVTELGNHRVLIWNTFPTVNGQPADLVIGQPDFVTGSQGTGPLKMFNPRSACSDGFQLFVADTDNSRVLIYSPFPTVSNAAPLRVLGQSNFTNTAANDDDQDGSTDATPTARTMNAPRGVTTFGNQVFVNDGNNNRVLIFTGS